MFKKYNPFRISIIQENSISIPIIDVGVQGIRGADGKDGVNGADLELRGQVGRTDANYTNIFISSLI